MVVLRRPTLKGKLKDKRRRILTRRLEEEKGCLLGEVIGKLRWDFGIFQSVPLVSLEILSHLQIQCLINADGEKTGCRISPAAEHKRFVIYQSMSFKILSEEYLWCE